MNTDELIPSLMLFTLVAAVIVAIVLLIRFLRKPKNRHPMEGERERNIGEIRAEGGDPLSPRKDLN